MQIEQLVFVIVAQNRVMPTQPQRFYVAPGRWSEERPDAKEFMTWLGASHVIDDAYNTDPRMTRAAVVAEEKEAV